MIRILTCLILDLFYQGQKTSARLLLLGVEHFLCYIAPYSRVLKVSNGILIGNQYVFKRPFLDSFLEYCLQKFDVALWSCEDEDYLNMILKAIMTDKELSRVKFILARNSCVQVDFCRNPTKKVLIMAVSQINFDERYAPENIVHIESTPHRTVFNSIWSSLFPPAYGGSSNDGILKNMVIPLLQKLVSSRDTLKNLLREYYPAWSVRCLRSDWRRNEEVWEHYLIQRHGDSDHIRMFNGRQPLLPSPTDYVPPRRDYELDRIFPEFTK